MTISRLDLDDYQDTALAAKAQMEQLHALFRQIQKELEDTTQITAKHLADLGNYLTDNWLVEYEELDEQLSVQTCGGANEYAN